MAAIALILGSVLGVFLGLLGVVAFGLPLISAAGIYAASCIATALLLFASALTGDNDGMTTALAAES